MGSCEQEVDERVGIQGEGTKGQRTHRAPALHSLALAEQPGGSAGGLAYDLPQSSRRPCLCLARTAGLLRNLNTPIVIPSSILITNQDPSNHPGLNL